MSATSVVPTYPKTVVLAAPRGFCAGVVRAIDIVDLALEAVGTPLYVRKEIVHNLHVVRSFEERGVRFVDDLSEVPDGQTVIFSAHGVSPAVRADAAARGLTVLDATCPLVTKVHLEAIRYARADFEIILIGHPSHEEVEGTLGEAADRMTLVSTVAQAETVQVANPERLAFLTQTTLSVEDTRPIVAALQRRFPGIQGPARADICYATQNRQLAVRAIAREAPVILVVGSRNSSNSNRLVEEAELAGARAYLVDDVSGVRREWLEGASSVGVTSGASAPDFLVNAILDSLRALGATEVREVRVVEEDVFFPLPPELAALRKARESALALSD
ncbi:MAG: 4-hydroxy-3-methylbut-2-enyl diphosphate reductase [Acidobacteriota bacterium]